jgi:hypothetical protein
MSWVIAISACVHQINARGIHLSHIDARVKLAMETQQICHHPNLRYEKRNSLSATGGLPRMIKRLSCIGKQSSMGNHSSGLIDSSHPGQSWYFVFYFKSTHDDKKLARSMGE